MLNLQNGATITVKSGDITTMRVDAIVNAANAYLVAGGGVSGAIHRAAGNGLTEECDMIALKRGPLRPGEAVITGGYNLPAPHVIHALGPIWTDGSQGEAGALDATYRSAIEVADLNRLRSIAFPSISTGIFGYPVQDAAPIAVRAVAEGLFHTQTVRDVMFVLLEPATYNAFAAALAEFS